MKKSNGNNSKSNVVNDEDLTLEDRVDDLEALFYINETNMYTMCAALEGVMLIQKKYGEDIKMLTEKIKEFEKYLAEYNACGYNE